jgi:protease I
MHVDRTKLRGKRIAILAADGFEYIELVVPQRALRAAGAEVDIISLHRGKIRGMSLADVAGSVRVDRTLDETDPGAYDGIYIPGGFIGPDFLRQSHQARTFVRSFDVANKPIATAGHGAWLLVSAELVAGRKLATWPGIRDDIVHAGGTWRDAPVVRDGNWVSSRAPEDLKDLVPAMISIFATGAGTQIDLSEEATGSETISSPRHEEPPKLAVAAARHRPGYTIRPVVGAAAATALAALAVRRVST